jgi:hypothetical protein
MKTSLLAIVLAAVGASVLVGCGSSEPSMSQSDMESFKGKPAGPMTAEKQKAISDFQAEFKKKHPSTGGPAVGGPPPGTPGAPASN